MSRSNSARAALGRALVVLAAFSGLLVGMAGTSLAAPVSENPTTTGTPVSSGPAVAGVSLGTFTWALVGFTLLVLGFIAASRSGRREPAVAPAGLASLGSVRTFQSVTHEAQTDSSTAAVIA